MFKALFSCLGGCSGGQSGSDNNINIEEELAKIEGFTVHGIAYDSIKKSGKQDLYKASEEIGRYCYRNEIFEALFKRGFFAKVHLVEMEDKSFRGIFIPREPEIKSYPMYDGLAFAFTIDSEHGFQIVNDERTKKHAYLKREPKRVQSQFVMMSQPTKDQEEEPIIEYDNFLNIFNDLKWSETPTGNKELTKRYVVVIMKRNEDYQLTPIIETDPMKSNHQEYINQIQTSFEVHPGKVIYDSIVPDDRYSKGQWMSDHEDFTFVVEKIRKYEKKIYVGFFAGRIQMNKWLKQPNAAIAKISNDSREQEIKFCPNRLPNCRCLKIELEKGEDLCFYFTKDYSSIRNEALSLAKVNERAAMEKMNEIEYGFCIVYRPYSISVDFAESKSFSEKKGYYNGSMECYARYVDEVRSKQRAQRFLVFSGMNVSQLEAKIKKTLGDDGYNDDLSDD